MTEDPDGTPVDGDPEYDGDSDEEIEAEHQDVDPDPITNVPPDEEDQPDE